MAINNLIVVSDLHCGCQFGLCSPEVQLDSGAIYRHGPVQEVIWKWWREFWDEWVPAVTRGEPFGVLVNGDAIDGQHHGSKTQITPNHADQEAIAYEVLAPIRERAEAMWMVRGTEAHVGQSAENEERLARRLGCVRNPSGAATHYEVWIRVGHGLVHATHHVGTTSSMAYETSALMREYSEMMTDAGRWHLEPPDVAIRSHRHRMCKVEVPTANVYGVIFTTPAWQAKTPFAYKVARVGAPQFGGALVRCGDEELYTRHFTRALPRDPVHQLVQEADDEAAE